MEEFQLREITKRLDVLISLVLQTVAHEGRSLSVRDQIRMLSELGLRPVEIAGTLGKTATFVNKELSVLRKPRKRVRE
jgi:hypothetical protein